MKTQNLLKDFDIKNLDPFEQMQYEHHIKYMDKENALQILINTVEGDLSQLSEELAKIAEQQEYNRQFDLLTGNI